ncbi:MAG: hypothetical protein V1875_00265 [Candidatus Altiarchaeota archaeon]
MAGRRLWWLALLAGSGLYLVNPGMGIIEFLPDNIPFIGNLDESVAVLVFLRSMIELGIIRIETVERILNLKPRYEAAILGKGKPKT